MVTMQVSNTVLHLNYGNAKCVSEIQRTFPDILYLLPWPFNYIGSITSKRPKKLVFKPPFHFSGTVFYDKVCAFASGGCQTSFFRWYNLLLLLFSRYGNFCLWDFQECFKISLERRAREKL